MEPGQETASGRPVDSSPKCALCQLPSRLFLFSVAREFFAQYSPERVFEGFVVGAHVISQGRVHQCLVVPAAGLVDPRPEPVENIVIDPDRDASLPWGGLEYRPSSTT